MNDRVRIPGSRDVPATLDGPEDPTAVVVACPPHPQMGGTRSDARLRAVADELADREVACLRIDYGPWDEGRAEQTDVRNALTWARETCERVALYGYSFGAGVGLLAAADADPGPSAVSVLAPPATILADGDVVEAVDAIDEREVPGLVCYGERDGTVDWKPVVERAREQGWALEAIAGDHFFAGQHGRVATAVTEFLAEADRSWSETS